MAGELSSNISFSIRPPMFVFFIGATEFNLSLELDQFSVFHFLH